MVEKDGPCGRPHSTMSPPNLPPPGRPRPTPHPKGALAKAISTKQVIHVADMRTTAAYLERSPASIELVELGGARTVAIVPMLRDDEVIGAITSIATRCSSLAISRSNS